MFPVFPKNSAHLMIYLAEAPTSTRDAFFKAIDALCGDVVSYGDFGVQNPRRALLASEAAKTLLQDESACMLYLQTVIILILSLQSAGPQAADVIDMPKMNELFAKAEYGITNLAASGEHQWFKRLLSLIVRSLGIFHTFGYRGTFSIVETIAKATSEDVKDLPGPALQFISKLLTPSCAYATLTWSTVFAEVVKPMFSTSYAAQVDRDSFLSKVHEFMTGESSNYFGATLAHIELLLSHVNSAKVENYQETAIAMVNKLIDNLYFNNPLNPGVYKPVDFFYFHGLATAVKTLKDLTNSPGSLAMDKIDSAKKGLIQLLSNIDNHDYSAWEAKAQNALVTDGPKGKVDFTSIIRSGYLNTLA